MSFSAPRGFNLFANEGGGHRWQRIPPNERRGRVHTSTVTVAVLHPATSGPGLSESEVDFVATRGTGPGGQHRNTTNSCIVATHRKTGLKVRVDMRSQHQSKAMALRILAAKIKAQQDNAAAQERNGLRRELIGSGMRGDKIRTYRSQDNRVTDHRDGRTWKLTDWKRGIW